MSTKVCSTAKTNAEKQADYRKRKFNDGCERLQVIISPDAKHALEQMALHAGLSQASMLERLIRDKKTNVTDEPNESSFDFSSTHVIKERNMQSQPIQNVKYKNNQVAMAFQSANKATEKMREDHGDTSFAIRDILLGMIEKSPDKRTVTIASGIAKRILDETNFPGQRKITPERLYAAKNRIHNEIWNPSHAVHFVLLEDGAMWLVNGQTRMQAIVDVGLPLKMAVIVQRVKDEKEARLVYMQFDDDSSKRTRNQMIDASGIVEKTELPKGYVVQVFFAVGIIAAGMRSGNRSEKNDLLIEAKNDDNRRAAVIEWQNEARLYLDAINGSGKEIRRKLQRAGTLAVALLTYRHQPKKAGEFWTRVADGVNLKKNDPRLVLSRDLAIRNTSVGLGDHSVQQSAVAWNAFYENRELKILKCIADWNLRIAGTPIGKNGNH